MKLISFSCVGYGMLFIGKHKYIVLGKKKSAALIENKTTTVRFIGFFFMAKKELTKSALPVKAELNRNDITLLSSHLNQDLITLNPINNIHTNILTRLKSPRLNRISIQLPTRNTHKISSNTKSINSTDTIQKELL